MEAYLNETYYDGITSGMTIPIGSVIQVEEENSFNYWGTWSNMMGTFKVCVPKKHCDEIIGQVNNLSDDKQSEFPSEIPLTTDSNPGKTSDPNPIKISDLNRLIKYLDFSGIEKETEINSEVFRNFLRTNHLSVKFEAYLNENPVETSDRTCFSCIHSNVCFLRKNITESTNNLRMNMDTDELPGKWIDIFKTLGNCCFEFKSK
jgi:hypothetical protein